MLSTDSGADDAAFDRSAIGGYLAVLLATACWGTSGIWVRFIVDASGVSALALAFYRDLVTFLVLFVGLRLLHPAWLNVRGRDMKWLVGLGGSLGVFHVFWNLGVLLNGAAVATVQQAAMPAIVTVAASVIWDEPLTGRKGLAIVLTFVGTVLVSGVDVLGEADITLGGFLIGLGIPFTYAGWNLFGKRVRGDYNPVTTLTYGFGFGALVLLPFQFLTPQPWPVSTEAALWFAGFITVATLLGFSLYAFALGRLQASVASILAMTEIPIVAVYAYFLLNERMSLDQIAGAALVIAGVVMLSRPKRRSRGS
ncbi:MAG: DMT family transporter [Chloroflexota bacterium]|nr:DMT family transporter [Chloroflexota bacterium]